MNYIVDYGLNEELWYGCRRDVLIEYFVVDYEDGYFGIRKRDMLRLLVVRKRQLFLISVS